MCCIGVKGDWPALCKLGNLQRHYGRESTVSESVGICHLCKAGQPDHPFHIYDYEKMKAARTDDPPWQKASDLTLVIPQSRDTKIMAAFFKIDLFHTGHKGVMSDVAANSIETILCIYNQILFRAILFLALQVATFEILECLGFPMPLPKVTLFDLKIDNMSVSSGVDRVYTEIAKFAKDNSLTLHMLQLSRTLLGFPNSWSYPAGPLAEQLCSKVYYWSQDGWCFKRL